MTCGGSDLIFLILTHMEEDGCTFWAQQHSPTIKMDLEHVTNRIEKVAKTKKFYVNCPSESRVYGCQFLDDLWYRCRVLFPMPKSKCLVQYIDYGNCQEKEQSGLVGVPIDMQESSIPAMAYRYHLYDVYIEPENIDNARKYIQSRCCDDFVKAKLMSRQDVSPTEVVLYDEDGQSICEQLIKAGFATTAASVKSKRSVVVSPPPVAQAQFFKNPLLSSTSSEVKVSHDWGKTAVRKNLAAACGHVSSGIESGPDSDTNGGPENLNRQKIKATLQCDNCQEYKEAAEKMRLLMMKLQHDLLDSEYRNKGLVEKEQFWKKKFMEVQEEKIRSEASGDGCVDRKKGGRDASQIKRACGDFLGGNPSAEIVENLQNDCNATHFRNAEKTYLKKTPQETGLSKKQEERISTMKPQENALEASPEEPALQREDNAAARMQPEGDALQKRVQQEHNAVRIQQERDALRKQHEAFEKSNAVVRKLVTPALELAKKLATYNKTIDNYLVLKKEMQDVVAKIKEHVEKGTDQNDHNFSAFVSRRNAIFEDLMQSVFAAFALAHSAHNAVPKERVDNFLAQLKCLFPDGKGDIAGEVGIAEVIEAIEEWKAAKESYEDLSTIGSKLSSFLTRQSEKYYVMNNLAEDIETLREHILAFKSQEKIIKDVSDVMKSIRKKKQKIRLLVAELRNLKEDEDVEPSEREELNIRMAIAEKDLTLQRRELQESFENKWILMENLADMVEKFSPELQTEHPEFGIRDYLKGKGIVIRDMELDHFDVKRTEWNGSTELFHTVYRGEKIVLHKCSMHGTTEQLWENVLQKIAIYTNIASPSVVVPIGIFVENESVYVMVTTPHLEASPLCNDVPSNVQTAQVILKDIARALSSLHQNGITHGGLTPKSILIAKRPKLQAYLDVPNFFTQLATCETESGENTLSKDIRLFGTLAKNLIRNMDHPKMQVMVDNCLKNCSSITMQNVIEAF